MKDYLKLFNSDITITIGGASMYPTFYIGERLRFRRRFDERELQEGKIILFYNHKYKEYIIHRIVNKINLDYGGAYYITKGDNNLIVDKYLVTLQDIRGIL